MLSVIEESTVVLIGKFDSAVRCCAIDDDVCREVHKRGFRGRVTRKVAPHIIIHAMDSLYCIL